MKNAYLIFAAVCLALTIHAHVKLKAVSNRNEVLEERTDTFTSICKVFADRYEDVEAQGRHCKTQVAVLKPYSDQRQRKKLKTLLAQRNAKYGIGGF